MFQPETAHTLSFILSYLALAGIIFIGEPVYSLLRGLVPDALARPLAASLGAFISTAAVVVACFGTLRPIGIIAGLAMIPLTTVFMLGAILFLVVGAIVPVAPVIAVLYDALTGVAVLAARIPGVSVSGPVPALLVSALVASACILLYYKQLEREHLLAAFD
jgi:competence protein ComEC